MTPELLTNGEMFNPPHPGEVLKMMHIKPSGLTVTQAAKNLGIDRKTLSRVLNGNAAITVDMALRLGQALSTSAKVWLGMQQAYDLWHRQHTNKLDLSQIKPWLSGQEERPNI